MTTPENKNLRIGILITVMVLATLTRFFPFMPNFSPLGAIALFGAAHFQRKWMAFLLPLAVIFLSDVIINNTLYAQYNSGFTLIYEGFYWQYGAFLLIALAGIFILKKINVARVIAGSLAATAIFFLVSNFGTWALGTMYPMTVDGLMQCYALGIPFIKNTFAGDLIFSAILFGGFALAQKQWPSLAAKFA